MERVIRVICDSGYDGVLIPNHSMKIRYEGREVLHTYSPTPKTYDELLELLETMPEFMELLKSHGIDRGARA